MGEGIESEQHAGAFDRRVERVIGAVEWKARPTSASLTPAAANQSAQIGISGATGQAVVVDQRHALEHVGFVRLAQRRRALQTYVRGLSPQSRYNRFLGAANELLASESARHWPPNGRDTLTLLLTSTVEDRETVVSEARVAFSCAKRAGEFGMSIACSRILASAQRCSRKSNAKRRPTASNGSSAIGCGPTRG